MPLLPRPSTLCRCMASCVMAMVILFCIHMRCSLSQVFGALSGSQLDRLVTMGAGLKGWQACLEPKNSYKNQKGLVCFDTLWSDTQGNTIVAGRKSPHSLYNEKIASFEDDEGLYDQKDAAGFIKLQVCSCLHPKACTAMPRLACLEQRSVVVFISLAGRLCDADSLQTLSRSSDAGQL